MSMTSSRPYIMRALYEWILDNDCTPYILVNAEGDGVEVPLQYVKNGQIVLNISPTAVVNLLIANDSISFNGRFGGVPTDVYVPMGAILGIYAKENGQGMIFELDDEPHPEPPKADSSGDKASRPALRVVK